MQNMFAVTPPQEETPGNETKKTAREEEQRLIRYLLQYLRIKNYVFGCTVQKKTVRGLDYFQKEFYQRDSGMNRSGGVRGGVRRSVHLL